MEIVNTPLSRFTVPIMEVLQRYTDIHDGKIVFGDIHGLKQTPNKNYSARTEVPVLMDGKEEGKLVIILFKEGDGTGKSNPKDPRSKEGVVAEGFFPILSASINNEKVIFSPYAAHLYGMHFNQKGELEPEFRLGQRQDIFDSAILGCREIMPKVSYTIARNNRGKAIFGDPHAIYSFKRESYPFRCVQIGGFLSIGSEDSPLIELTDYWFLPHINFNS